MKTGAVVVVWRDEPITLDALRSLGTMTVVPDLTVCVAQGCSAGFVEQLREAAPPGGEVLSFGENLGFAEAVNRGFGRALDEGCQWILLLNNDATVDPMCLETCLDEATRSPGAAILGPAIRMTDDPSRLWYAGGVHSRHFGYTRFPGLGEPSAHPPLSGRTGYVPGCCALVSAAAWRDIGGYRSDYFLYFEDTEWCARARERGWTCEYIGDVLCSHAVSVSSGQRGSLGLSENTAYYLARNPLRYALETPTLHLRVTRILGIMTIWLGYNLIRIARSGRSAVARSYLQGTLDALAGRMGPRGAGQPLAIDRPTGLPTG